MDYRQLRAFIAVFEERNITAAARSIHLSQPALSGSIRALEQALGTTLFVRQARGVEVTEDARALYPEAQRMVADANRLLGRFKGDRERAPLQIGVEQDVSAAVLGQVVLAAAGIQPPVRLQLVSGCMGEVRLASEELRCEDELFLPLHSDPFVLAVAHQTTTTQARWVTCPAQPSHQRLQPFYSGILVAEADTFALALELVAAGVGAAIVPESLATEHRGVRIEPMPQLDLRRRIGLCYSAQALTLDGVIQLRDALQG
ncbi:MULTISPECIES: LysR family transcriptional regulator [Pseudomonas]|jgi:DNA-binding transcriptional LysR family regulator|uniref:LysR family transcriptional regulator n=1 Tax=Pseudomonas putida TaxID=303 RepID=A0A1L7NBC7_PSEPU|nr:MULTISPECIES: LysR family transcriptional regulator [Pseudomonas]PNB55364.1 LysR family transcriptional regulator [Pseudomonas sp. FW305-130]PYG97480.1 LysR family transcriptional regulator [Arthrobacter stackebrandtii]AGN81681.1 LysR family transcriptional regulator [Pseudomonas putida H8234]EKT4449955.1 LysR family transcriptional regulator [Pseudomonas putida]MBH3470974.1 LysR family transcriptional regulator [Pseudomonas putida]